MALRRLPRSRCGREGGERRALALLQGLRPPAVLPLGEQGLEPGDHLLGEQARVVLDGVGRQVAELHHQHQLADVERRRQLAELLDHLVRRADDDVAVVDDALHVAGKRGQPRRAAGGDAPYGLPSAAILIWLSMPARWVASVT